jgi:hypothetical protein
MSLNRDFRQESQLLRTWLVFARPPGVYGRPFGGSRATFAAVFQMHFFGPAGLVAPTRARVVNRPRWLALGALRGGKMCAGSGQCIFLGITAAGRLYRPHGTAAQKRPL